MNVISPVSQAWGGLTAKTTEAPLSIITSPAGCAPWALRCTLPTRPAGRCAFGALQPTPSLPQAVSGGSLLPPPARANPHAATLRCDAGRQWQLGTCAQPQRTVPKRCGTIKIGWPAPNHMHSQQALALLHQHPSIRALKIPSPHLSCASSCAACLSASSLCLAASSLCLAASCASACPACSSLYRAARARAARERLWCAVATACARQQCREKGEVCFGRDMPVHKEMGSSLCIMCSVRPNAIPPTYLHVLCLPHILPQCPQHTAQEPLGAVHLEHAHCG